MKKGNVNLTVEVAKDFRDNLKILAIKEGKDLRTMVTEVLNEYYEKNKK